MLDVSGLCFFLSDNPDRRLIIVYLEALSSRHGSKCGFLVLPHFRKQNCQKYQILWLKNHKIQPRRRLEHILTHVLFSVVWLMLFWVFLTCKTNASMNMFDKIKKLKNKKYTAWTFIASSAARLSSWFHFLCCSTTCWVSPAWCTCTTEKTSTTKNKRFGTQELENRPSKSASYCDHRVFTSVFKSDQTTHSHDEADWKFKVNDT